MKDLFRSFKKPSAEELKELWENAVFVLDTNVLHSVYRYQSETCEEVLTLMEQLQDRIWIPYHVALEFHRNRLSVIGGQHKKFDDTRQAIEKAVEALGKDLNKLQLKKRHSHINPDPLLDGIKKLTKDYMVKLDEQEASSLKIESEDHLLGRIESILNGRVGDKPESEAIKKIMDLGKGRYKSLIPPGYKDAVKEKESDNKYSYDGVEYERQFGDLIVWNQLIEYADKQDKKHLIFVTDDNKEDWWQITKGKTTGFRVELINEIYSKTGLVCFNAYSLSGFLANAKQFLQESVSEEAIEEVKLTSVIEFKHNIKTTPSFRQILWNKRRLSAHRGSEEHARLKYEKQMLDQQALFEEQLMLELEAEEHAAQAYEEHQMLEREAEEHAAQAHEEHQMLEREAEEHAAQAYEEHQMLEREAEEHAALAYEEQQMLEREAEEHAIQEHEERIRG
ncbi:PIN domain-containing protein [Vibrio splendidus]|uniref:PIN domain-containing protein n=2 Tax=Vibrio splendidus TaxID=29497 RepID=A0AA43G2R3_VIBSP|nr:PIN-like domain-containing protein [Vibrio splendidus]MDH5924529.1 PIN domain-containing protein [Vibrio splendidus]